MRNSNPTGDRDNAVHRWGMRWAALSFLIVLGLVAWACLGENRRGQIGDAVQTVRDGAQDASTSVQGKIAEVRTSARNVGLEQKISARLHGDRSLGAEQIEVSVLEEGTATLKGLVPHAEAKAKAVALTRDTRGVMHVVDQLAVPPPARIYGAPEPAPEPEPAVATRSRTLR